MFSRCFYVVILVSIMALAGCGDNTSTTSQAADNDVSARTIAPDAPWGKGVRIATLGDSITQGSPAFFPETGDGDPESQYQWAMIPALGQPVSVRNCGVYGERVDEIAKRYQRCTQGAHIVILQGGINNIAQSPEGVVDAPDAYQDPSTQGYDDFVDLIDRAWQDGKTVVVTEILPWNNGSQIAAGRITGFNNQLNLYLADENKTDYHTRPVIVLPWYELLKETDQPRMKASLTVDGDHPSVAGYAILGRETAKMLKPLVNRFTRSTQPSTKP